MSIDANLETTEQLALAPVATQCFLSDSVLTLVMQLHTAGILCYFIGMVIQLVCGNLTENSDFFKLVQDLRHSVFIDTVKP